MQYCNWKMYNIVIEKCSYYIKNIIRPLLQVSAWFPFSLYVAFVAISEMCRQSDFRQFALNCLFVMKWSGQAMQCATFITVGIHPMRVDGTKLALRALNRRQLFASVWMDLMVNVTKEEVYMLQPSVNEPSNIDTPIYIYIILFSSMQCLD